jgi:hydrogenase nickel incorporation protein HypA/HybF
MHEVGIMEEILTLATEHAARHDARRICRLTVRVGALSGVDADALRFAFDAVTPGTVAEGAEFRLEAVPVACFCPGCRCEFEPAELFYECPRCGRLTADVRRGRELELASLEVL